MSGNPPTGKVSAAYAKSTKINHLFPVTSDPNDQLILKATPWDGMARPGKCVLTPVMEILYCYVGADDAQAFASIKMHAGK